MAMTFADFVQTELPKRPFAEIDGQAGQVLARSNRPERPRELTWVDQPAAGFIAMTAGPDGVSGHRAIMVLPDGSAAHAEPMAALSFIGISTQAALAGEPVKVAMRDTITESSWAWTPGQPVYYLAGGTLTQTIPAETAFTPIGLAITATSILIQRETPVFFGA